MSLVASSGENSRVMDVGGNTFLMSMVKAIPSSTAFVSAPDFAMGGSRKVDDRRREALRQWLPMLLERIRRAENRGLSVQQASRETAAVPGFQQALRDQRATLMQFAQLWPDEIRIEKRGTQNVMFARARPRDPRPQAPEAAPTPRPQEPQVPPHLRLWPPGSFRREAP